MAVVAPEDDGRAPVAVREFDAHSERDRAAVERLERACEVGPSGGKLCLFTDLLGDPLCRVRHSPAYLMLVRPPSKVPDDDGIGMNGRSVTHSSSGV
jgi:hypothetical protein